MTPKEFIDQVIAFHKASGLAGEWVFAAALVNQATGESSMILPDPVINAALVTTALDVGIVKHYSGETPDAA